MGVRVRRNDVDEDVRRSFEFPKPFKFNPNISYFVIIFNNINENNILIKNQNGIKN